MYSAGDIYEILKLPAAQFKQTLMSLPESDYRTPLKLEVFYTIDSGTFDSISKIKAADEICGTDLFCNDEVSKYTMWPLTKNLWTLFKDTDYKLLEPSDEDVRDAIAMAYRCSGCSPFAARMIWTDRDDSDNSSILDLPDIEIEILVLKDHWMAGTPGQLVLVHFSILVAKKKILLLRRTNLINWCCWKRAMIILPKTDVIMATKLKYGHEKMLSNGKQVWKYSAEYIVS